MRGAPRSSWGAPVTPPPSNDAKRVAPSWATPGWATPGWATPGWATPGWATPGWADQVNRYWFEEKGPADRFGGGPVLDAEIRARFAEQHRDVIARFGRFPGRNAALGRPSTARELAFLASGETSW